MQNCHSQPSTANKINHHQLLIILCDKNSIFAVSDNHNSSFGRAVNKVNNWSPKKKKKTNAQQESIIANCQVRDCVLSRIGRTCNLENAATNALNSPISDRFKAFARQLTTRCRRSLRRRRRHLFRPFIA